MSPPAPVFSPLACSPPGLDEALRRNPGARNEGVEEGDDTADGNDGWGEGVVYWGGHDDSEGFQGGKIGSGFW